MEQNYIVLFDGVCNFCNSTVNFIIERDKKNIFQFAPLQESAGKSLLQQYQLDTKDLDSIVLIKNKKAYIKSDAALEIAKDLTGLWKILVVFKIIPTFLRDKVYDFIAANRYRIFGKKESCSIPTPELRAKFISQ
jgi:predicted DCC family thiol-disulfide oxidoreductase YuxK